MNRQALLDQNVVDQLLPVYGERTCDVLRALSSMGPRYYFRLNIREHSVSSVIEEMRSAGLDVTGDQDLLDAAYIPTRETVVDAKGTPVLADRFAAEAVLQGAHLYARGVKNCRGLKRGAEACVVDVKGDAAGLGIARQSETGILTYRHGMAVEVTQNRFGLPSLMETTWYGKGQIHLQSLPAMLTSRMLDPRPGETIVDMNCAPGGKMSHLCQMTGNSAHLVGFDRNTIKIDKTRKNLERLGCDNYRLSAHDSRYLHLDYTIRGDKVLVDPPCTGLGVTPKLSLETTTADVNNLSNYQKQFLTSASHIVKPGGIVVYSVCTVTLAECEEVVEYATNTLGLALVEATPMLGRRGEDPEGLTQRFDPDVHGQGYFIAKFQKKW